jgi:predicted nucleic acid-binding protein
MSDKRFFDTNILFYAYDTSDPAKQAKSATLS